MQLLVVDMPMVRLSAARNPAVSAEVLSALLRDPDPWVVGLAASHRSADVGEMTTLVESGTQLPWVLQRIANNPHWPADRVDEVLTWITLGGAGPGDPGFDPSSCSSNPHDASEPMASFLQRETDSGNFSLWPARLAATTGGPRSSNSQLWDAARDESVHLRRRAAQFNLQPVLEELSHDDDITVRDTATRIRRTTRLVGEPRPPLWSRYRGFLVATAIGVVVLGIGANANRDPGVPPTLSVPGLVSTAATQNIHVSYPPVLSLDIVDGRTRRTIYVTAIADSLSLTRISGVSPDHFPIEMDSPATMSFDVLEPAGDVVVVAADADGVSHRYAVHTGK